MWVKPAVWNGLNLNTPIFFGELGDGSDGICFIHTAWWFLHLWKIVVNWDDDIPNIWEHKTCSKPPTSCGMFSQLVQNKIDGNQTTKQQILPLTSAIWKIPIPAAQRPPFVRSACSWAEHFRDVATDGSLPWSMMFNDMAKASMRESHGSYMVNILVNIYGSYMLHWLSDMVFHDGYWMPPSSSENGGSPTGMIWGYPDFWGNPPYIYTPLGGQSWDTV